MYLSWQLRTKRLIGIFKKRSMTTIQLFIKVSQESQETSCTYYVNSFNQLKDFSHIFRQIYLNGIHFELEQPGSSNCKIWKSEMEEQAVLWETCQWKGGLAPSD